MFPTSGIIFLDSVLKGLHDWFFRGSYRRACRSRWFSIFWLNWRTLILCAYFRTECGMSASFTIIKSWLTSWSTTDFSILLHSISSSTLSVSASWQTWESFSCMMNSNRSSRSVMSLLTLRLILCSERIGRPDLSRIGFGVGWFDWENFASRATSPSTSRATFEPNSHVHSWRIEIFEGGRDDMLTYSYKISPVFRLTTVGILLWLVSQGSTDGKNIFLSLVWISTSRYQSRVEENEDWIQIQYDECVGRIRSKINKFARKINNYSWIIIAVLVPPFWPSYYQVYFPSIVRPMNRLRKWNLKIFFCL